MKQTTPTSMQAAAIDRFGGIETIQLQTLPVPDIGPDEVLIRVEVAGVGVWDAFEREGGFAQMFGIKPKFPYVLGSDGAGTIAAVGDCPQGAFSRFGSEKSSVIKQTLEMQTEDNSATKEGVLSQGCLDELVIKGPARLPALALA